MKKSASDDTHHVAQNAFIKRLRKGLTLDETLRWNQRDVINTTIDFLNAKNGATVTEHDSKNGDEAKPISIKKGPANAALIESSPGSGKTRMMGFIAKQAAHLNGADPTHKSTDAVKVLILTPRLDLNRQTLHEFDEELGIKDKDTALYDSNQIQIEKNRAKSAPVLIATYQSLPAMLQDGTISLDPKSPQYRGLIEMDEVHELVNFKCKAKGSLQEATIDSFINDHQTTLLFTGTDDGVSERHFKGKVPTIYSKRLVKAHNQGLTCDPIYPGLVDVSVKETGFDTEKKKDRSKELVDYFGSHPKVIEAAVDAQLTADHPGMGPLKRYKSLFFVNGVDAGRNGKDYFNKKAKELKLMNPKTGDYLKAAHIHAKTPKAERKDIIKAYKNGEIAAIFNDSILTFGFDDREAAVIHNLKMHDRETGARALAQMEQIFTRGTRICDGFKKKPALDGKPYGIDKQALLLTYRPIDGHGQPLNVLTSTDLLAGLILPVKTSREWQFRGGNDEDTEKKRKSLSDDFEVHLHFDFDDQIAISEAMRKQYEQGNQQYPSLNGTDMLGSIAMAEKAQVQRNLSGVYDKLYDQWKKRSPTFDYEKNRYVYAIKPDEPISVTFEDKKYEIPLEKCGVFQSGAQAVFYIHESQSYQFKKAPDLSPGMLKIDQMAKRAGTDKNNLSLAFKTLYSEWEKCNPVFDAEKGHYVATEPNPDTLKVIIGEKLYNIPVMHCGVFKVSEKQYSFCVHESQDYQFAIAPKVTTNLLLAGDMAQKARVQKSKEFDVPRVYQELKEAWQKRKPVFDYEKQHYTATVGGTDPLVVQVSGKMYEIPIEKCGVYRSGPQYPFCVDESEVQKFEAAPKQPVGMLVSSDMAPAARTNRGNIDPAYKALEKEWRKLNPTFDYAKGHYVAKEQTSLKVTIEEKSYDIPIEKCGLYRCGNRVFFCVDKSQSSQFAIAPEKSGTMLNRDEMATKIQMAPYPLGAAYNLFEKEWQKRKPVYSYEDERYIDAQGSKEPLKVNYNDKDYSIPLEQCGIFMSGTRTPFCINTTQSGMIRSLALAIREAGKTQTPPVKPHSIKPDSDHIRNRSGRSRSAKDE